MSDAAVTMTPKVAYAALGLLGAQVGVSGVETGRDVFAPDNPGALVAALQEQITEDSERLDRVVAAVQNMNEQTNTTFAATLTDIKERITRMETRAQADREELSGEILRVVDALDDLRDRQIEMQRASGERE